MGVADSTHGNMRNFWMCFIVGKHEGQRPDNGMIRWRWIIGYHVVYWIQLTQDKVRWRAVFVFPKGGKLIYRLSCCKPLSFSRKFPSNSSVLSLLVRYMAVLHQTAAVQGSQIAAALAIGPSFNSPLQSLLRSGGVTLMPLRDVWQTPGAWLSYRTAHELTNTERDAPLLWYD